MKKYVLYLLSALLSLTVAAQDAGTTTLYNDVSFKSLTPFAENGNTGVSAPFAGLADGKLVVAGGCNFPGTPAADGGQKVFYSQIYVLADPLNGNSKWEAAGQLPTPVAYGASVTVSDGVVCIGGTADGVTSLKSVMLINGKGEVKQLPELPVGLDNMAAGYGADYIYVACGNSEGNASKKAYRLKYPDGNAWEELPDVPGTARLQPAGTYQAASVGGNFYVMGGYDPATGKVHTNGVYYNPKEKSWKETAEIIPFGETEAMTLVGATCVNSGAAHVIFFGGVNKGIFEQALERIAKIGQNQLSEEDLEQLRKEQDEYMRQPSEWYKFHNNLLIYHTVTNTWVRHFESDLIARAGAVAVPMKDASGHTTWILVGGEEKPGVRSAAVTDVDMSYTANFGWLNWCVLVLYLLSMLYLGYYFMKRESSSEDFFKGGGRIPWWAAGISIFATMLSAITYMSIPAKAYATNWTYYPMQIMILLVSFPVIKYYLPFFRRLNVTTAYEYLERRFNYVMRLMASVLFIVFMVARMALVLFLPSLAMTAVTGINIFICIILMAVITIVYCTMGGVEAVVWGDVIQGIILVGGAILAAGYLIVNTGNGAGDFFDIAFADDKFRMFEWSFDWRSATFWVVILGGIGNNLISYTSDQTVIQRYLTTKDEKSAARGILTNGILSVVVTIAFFTIGTGLYTFFKTHPAEMDMTMAKSDAIFPFFMMSQLPAGLAGLLIAAVFAATMSTIASNINSVSTAFTVDIWNRYKKNVTDEGTLRTARVAGVISGVIGMLIAILMATVDIQSLLDYFNTILGLLSGAIGGVFMMGIFFPRISAGNALIGFVCGTATVFYMNFYTEVNFLLFGFVSMLVSVVVALLLSFAFPNKKQQNGLTWQTLPKEKE